MARNATFANKFNLVKSLENKDNLSRFLSLQLVEKGYLKVVPVKHEGRGRPSHLYELTGKARGYLALARNWGKKSDNLIVAPTPSDIVNTPTFISDYTEGFTEAYDNFAEACFA